MGQMNMSSNMMGNQQNRSDQQPQVKKEREPSQVPSTSQGSSLGGQT